MEKYSEWRNTTSGHLGVIKYDDEGKPRGASIPPGGVVLLSERERVATANAPRKPANNPFQNGALVCITAEAELSHRRPIGDASQPAVDPQPEAPPEPPEETGSAPAPEGEAPQGQAAPHEEVASPPPPDVSVEQVEPAAAAPAPVPVAQDEAVPAPTPKPTPKP